MANTRYQSPSNKNNDNSSNSGSGKMRYHTPAAKKETEEKKAISTTPQQSNIRTQQQAYNPALHSGVVKPLPQRADRPTVVSNVPQQNTPQQQISQRQAQGAQAAANFQRNYVNPPLQNVSVMPGVTPQLKQGGYIVNTQAGYKTPEPRYLPATPENRQIAAKEAGYLRTAKPAPKKYETFTSENVLMALPIPAGLKTSSRVAAAAESTAVAQAEKAAAPIAAKAEPYLAKAASYLPGWLVGAYNKVAPTKTYQYAKGAAAAVGTAEVVRYGVTEGSALGLTAEQKAIRAEPGFKAAVGTAYAQTGSDQFNQAWYKGVAYQIPGVPLAIGRDTFKATVTQQFQQQGYSGAELDKRVNVAMGELYAGQIGEGAGFLSISRSSEKIGRGLIAGSFEKAAAAGETATTKTITGTMFRKAGWQIAKAGIVEGAGAEIVQERARYAGTQKPLFTETFSDLAPDVTLGKYYIPQVKTNARITDIGLMGVFGGVSAGVIGGGIAATSVKYPTVSKTIETAAFITDPFEKPGDVLQNVVEAGQKRFYKIEPSKPSIYMQVKPEDIITFKGADTVAPTKQTPGKVYSFGIPNVMTANTPTKTNIPTTMTAATPPALTNNAASAALGINPVPPRNIKVGSHLWTATPLGTPTPTTIKERGFSGGGFSNVPGITPTPTPVPTPFFNPPTVVPSINIPSNPFNNIPNTPFTPIPTTPPTTPFTNVPTTPLTETPINPLTNIPVNPFTNIGIPTTVPVGRIPPPMPLAFSDLFGGGASYAGKRKLYINELAAGSNLLGNLMYNRPIQPIGKHLKTTSLQQHRNKATKHKSKKKRYEK